MRSVFKVGLNAISVNQDWCIGFQGKSKVISILVRKLYPIFIDPNEQRSVSDCIFLHPSQCLGCFLEPLKKYSIKEKLSKLDKQNLATLTDIDKGLLCSNFVKIHWKISLWWIFKNGFGFFWNTRYQIDHYLLYYKIHILSWTLSVALVERWFLWRVYMYNYGFLGITGSLLF